MTWYMHSSGQVTECRISHGDKPVVVIDPEGNPAGLGYLNPLHFRRYAEVLRAAGWPHAAAMQEWLADRFEEARPAPKPDEPTGLGAVVEDACGDRWVLTERDSTPGTLWWVRPGVSTPHWSSIDAVKVLSPGVPGE
jgi:hypothetical protein